MFRYLKSRPGSGPGREPLAPALARPARGPPAKARLCLSRVCLRGARGMTPLPALPGTTQQGSKVGQCICDVSWACPRPSHRPAGPGEASLRRVFYQGAARYPILDFGSGQQFPAGTPSVPGPRWPMSSPGQPARDLGRQAVLLTSQRDVWCPHAQQQGRTLLPDFQEP